MAIKASNQISIVDVTDAYSVILSSEAYTSAHVYKAGVEQSITDAGVVANSLGSIKWYKVNADGSLGTAKATAKTYTVTASDVQNCQAYTCQLEA